MDNPMTLEDKKHNYTETEKQFLNLLNETRLKKGKASHTGVGWCTGKYLIEDNNLTEFYKIYAKMMQQNSEILIIEQHADIGPIIVDIDMRFKLEMTNRVYGFSFIREICGEYIKQIKEYFDLSEEDMKKYLVSFVFERPEPYESKNQMKDGIHIMFPFIVSDPSVQHIIRENVIKNLEELFKTLPLENNIYNAIDKAVIDQVGWYMYGSTKPGVKRYELVHIFDYNLNSIDGRRYNEFKLPELLSIRNKTETTPINESKFEEINNYKLKTQQKKQARKKESSSLTQEDYLEIYELVNILSPSRADDYEQWLNLGFALHSIDPQNEDLLEIWDEFSKKSHKYEKNACHDKWHKTMDSKIGGLNIGSIHYWAKSDNPDKYKEFSNNQIRTYIEQSLTGTNVDIAKVMYKMYKHLYVCAGIKTQKWFYFNRHRWVEDESGIGLRTKVGHDLVQEYCRLISYLNEKLGILEDEKEEELDKKKKFELESKIKQMSNRILRLTDITKNLKSTSFIDNVMKECRGLFYNKEFMNKLDENHFLFCFKNGVLDLKTGEFRDGKPDDYISLSCGVNYVPYKPDLPCMDDINDFLDKVQTNPNLKKYLLTLLSSLLEGHNADESFHVWTGTGGNGKSKVNELLVEAMGEYSCKFPITLFTGKRGASNAVSPEVVESKGKRYVYMEEPSDGDKINVGLMKEYTGGDKIKGRGLWANFIEFKPQFKVILFCNDMPKVPAEDQGTWRRMKVLEFSSSFKANPRKENENEFKIDKYLGEKIPKWAQSFMALLVHYYFTIYKVQGGLSVPQEVLQYTEEYQKDMDIYADFIDSKLIKTDKKTDKISLQSVHDDFKIWYQANYNCQKFPLKRDMKKHFSKKYGPKTCTTTHIIGFIKNQNANEKDEEDEN